MRTSSASRPPSAAPKAGVGKGRSRTKVRLRSCVACREKSDPAELTRWVLAGEGVVLPDLAGRSFGRGAWLHPRPGCLHKARAGFSRAFKEAVCVDPAGLVELLRAAADRRVLALLAAARRSKQLVVGKTAVEKVLSSSTAPLLMVATDAQSAARSTPVERAVAAGRAVAWGTKDVLGGLAGRTEVGVLLVMDDGLANALKATIAMAQSAGSADGRSGSPTGKTQQRVSDQQARAKDESSTDKSSTEVG